MIDTQTLKWRNPLMLSLRLSGVNDGSVAHMRPFDNSAIDGWSIGGGANRSNELLTVGVPSDAQTGSDGIADAPTLVTSQPAAAA